MTLTMGTVNCMLLCPLHTQTSPNRTSLREMLPNSEEAVITNGEVSSVAGRVTLHRHTVPLSGQTEATPVVVHYTVPPLLEIPGVRVAGILVELKVTATAWQSLT